MIVMAALSMVSASLIETRVFQKNLNLTFANKYHAGYFSLSLK